MENYLSNRKQKVREREKERGEENAEIQDICIPPIYTRESFTII